MIARMVGACLLWMGLAMGAQAQEAAYLRELPTAAEILQQVQGSNPAQTLGRQCAALTELAQWNFFPFRDMETVTGKAVRAQYRAAATRLGEEYARQIKPLTDADNKREWYRMCQNYRSSSQPKTWGADTQLPALDTPLTNADFMALLKPSGRAVATQQMQARQAKQAADGVVSARQTAMLEANARKSRDMTRLVLGAAIGSIVSLVLAVLLMRKIGFERDPQGQRVLINGRPHDFKFTRGVVTGAPQKNLETVVGTHVHRNSNGQDTVTHSSHTVTHDSIFILTDEGKTDHLKLRNWDVDCLEGHELVALRLSLDGTLADNYAVICNLTSERHWIAAADLKWRLSPKYSWLAVCLVLLSGLLSLGVGLVVGGIWYWMRLRKINRETQALGAHLFECCTAAPKGMVSNSSGQS